VRATSKTEPLVQAGAELVLGDVCDPASLRPAVADVDAVYHLAGVTASLRLSEMMEVNVRGVAHLAAACAACPNPPVLTLVSSVAAAGPTRRGQVRKEEDPPAPVSHYGRSKRGGELAAQKWASSVPTTIIRPGIVIGPRNRELLPAFQAIKRTNIHVVPTFAPPPLSLIPVEDLVEILVRAAERGERIAPRDGVPGDGKGYYFACMDEYPNYLQLGKMIARAIGRRHLLPLTIDSHLSWLIAGTVDCVAHLRGRAVHFSVDKMRDATAGSWACSIASLRNEIGFHFPRSLADRLRENVLWYEQHGWL
jgi:nucleoside-diphosphate-sugar epimerase